MNKSIFFLFCFCRTCKRTLKLIKDRHLWKTFDFTGKRSQGKQIKKLVSLIPINDINVFKVRGYISKYPAKKWKNNTITLNTLRKLSSSCPRLETLEIHEAFMNFQKVG